VELAESMLFVELAKAEGGWLWHNGRIDNKQELVPGYCLGEFVVERAKGRIRDGNGSGSGRVEQLPARQQRGCG
jgi:hypothetical protein